MNEVPMRPKPGHRARTAAAQPARRTPSRGRSRMCAATRTTPAVNATNSCWATSERASGPSTTIWPTSAERFQPSSVRCPVRPKVSAMRL